MVNAALGWICLLLVAVVPVADGYWFRSDLGNGVNGGADCATCSILLGLVDHLTIVYNETAEHTLERLCNFLPDKYRGFCKLAVEYLGKVIIDGFIKKDNPDVICHTLKFCKDEPGLPKCRLYPSNESIPIPERVSNVPPNADPKICDVPGIKEICKILDNAFDNHIPSVDLDGDRFGTEPTLRGTSWRGKDCDDFTSKIHPGAHVVNGDAVDDSNCNGIFGMDSSTGKPWEEVVCIEEQRMGIAVLGDSISAHFHIPEEWLDAKQFSIAAFEHFGFILEDELDWPEMSATTGHLNLSWPNINGTTRSLYLRLFDNDHCIHRDYQNIAVNGARSGNMLETMKSLARNQIHDVPMLTIYSMVGNDVCNGHPDTFDHMTTPDEMYKNVMATLAYLDTVLPKGSHVLTTGLGNGSLLYDLLHDHIHPFGRVGPPITYPQMYNYLECLQISPCNGWLTSNSTVRDLTTQRAVELSQAVQNATLTYQAINFDSAYLDFPFNEAMQRWIDQGGEPWQLIEPVDGFHINQWGHALSSDIIWEWLQKNKPLWIPPRNERNDIIERVFKDQGGY